MSDMKQLLPNPIQEQPQVCNGVLVFSVFAQVIRMLAPYIRHFKTTEGLKTEFLIRSRHDDGIAVSDR